MSNLHTLSTLVLGGILAAAPALEARTCSGNADLIGGYGWIAGRAAQFVPVAASAPGTTAIVGSNTAVGALAAGAANSAVFVSVGRLFLDGNGGMFSTATPSSPVAQVGTYSVNPDCTISATFTDTFATPGGAGLTPVQASATFEGVVVQNANEIDLIQTGPASGATVTLKKTRQYNGCSNDGLTGTFGLAAVGVAATPAATPDAAPTSQAFTLFGRFNADGLGNFVQDSVGLVSPLAKRQFTGTYTVNLDCTGTGTLVGSDAKVRKINFVVVNPGGPNANASTQSLVLSFADTGVIGSGIAQQQ